MRNFRRLNASPKSARVYLSKYCKTEDCKQLRGHEVGFPAVGDQEAVEPTPHDLARTHVNVCHTAKCRQPEGHAGEHSTRSPRRAKLGQYGPHPDLIIHDEKANK